MIDQVAIEAKATTDHDESGPIYHIYPLDEKKHHKLNGCECRCNPQITKYALGTVVVHYGKDDQKQGI